MAELPARHWLARDDRLGPDLHGDRVPTRLRAVFSVFGRPSFPHRGQLVEMLYHILRAPQRAAPVAGHFLGQLRDPRLRPVHRDPERCAQRVAEVAARSRGGQDRRAARASRRLSRLPTDRARHGRIHWLIYLPFVSLLFLVLARSNLFDAMDFPLPLIFVTGLALAYALYTAVLLRRSAEAARARALAHYDARLLAQAQPKDSQPPTTAGAAAAGPTRPPISAEQIKLLMERIRSTREGAFAPFTQQPALQALLLPFGGYGGVQLVEYLINF